MDDMKIAIEAINLYQSQYTQVDKLWSYFSIVSLAVAGFVIGNEKATKSFKEPIAIIIAYLVFCLGNCLALIDGQILLIQLADHARTLASTAQIPLSGLKATPKEGVLIFYLSVVIAFTLSLLAVSYFRYKHITKK